MLAGLQTCVRPIVTLLFAGALVAGFLLGKISADVFSQLAGMVLSFWFAQRQAEKVAGGGEGGVK